MKTEVEDMSQSWTQESRAPLGQHGRLQTPDHRPWPDHLLRQWPPTINERLHVMGHRTYNDHQPSLPIGHHWSSIISRPLEARQMPDLIDSEGEAESH